MNTFYYSLRYINNNENEQNNKEELRNITFSVFSTLYTTNRREEEITVVFLMQLEPFRMHFVLRLPFGRLVKILQTSQSDPKQFARLYYLSSIYNVHNEDKYFGNKTTRLVKYISSLLSLNRKLYKVEKESISSAIKFYLSIRLLG